MEFTLLFGDSVAFNSVSKMTAIKILFFVAFCSIVEECFLQNARTDENSDLAEVHERFERQIVPGTKWCGRGNKAKAYDDLGLLQDTDECCRTHDLCPMNILANQTKYGLTNTDKSTISHCNCDKELHTCLRKSNTAMSRAVGHLYFNILRKMCFQERNCPEDQPCPEEYEFVSGQCWHPSKEEILVVMNFVDFFL